MASHKLSHSMLLGEVAPLDLVATSRPRDTPPRIEEVKANRSLVFDGHQYVATTTRSNLDSVRNHYGVPELVVLSLPKLHRGRLALRDWPFLWPYTP